MRAAFTYGSVAKSISAIHIGISPLVALPYLTLHVPDRSIYLSKSNSSEELADAHDANNAPIDPVGSMVVNPADVKLLIKLLLSINIKFYIHKDSNKL